MEEIQSMLRGERIDMHKEKQNNLNVLTNGHHAYEVALIYLKRKIYTQAEKWLRYAINNGHEGAAVKLQDGIKKQNFQSIQTRMRSFAIEILEFCVNVEPTEEQFDELENILMDYLDARIKN